MWWVLNKIKSIMAKYTLNFLHICEQVIVSSDGKATIVNIFDKIKIKEGKELAMMPKFAIISHISSSESDTVVQTISIKDKDDNFLMGGDGNSVFIKNQENNNGFIVNFIGQSFKEGKYFIEVKIDDCILTNKNNSRHFISVIK